MFYIPAFTFADPNAKGVPGYCKHIFLYINEFRSYCLYLFIIKIVT